MSEVHLWLKVWAHRAWPSQGHDVLWTRTVDMGHLPHVYDGNSRPDRICTFDDPDSGFMMEIRDRYWDHDGVANISLLEIVNDPDEEGEKQINEQFGTFATYRYHVWRPSEDGGELEVKLEASGWHIYRGSNEV